MTLQSWGYINGFCNPRRILNFWKYEILICFLNLTKGGYGGVNFLNSSLLNIIGSKVDVFPNALT